MSPSAVSGWDLENWAVTRLMPFLTCARPSLFPNADDKFGDAFGFTYEEFSDVTLGVDPNVSGEVMGC